MDSNLSRSYARLKRHTLHLPSAFYRQARASSSNADPICRVSRFTRSRTQDDQQPLHANTWSPGGSSISAGVSSMSRPAAYLLPVSPSNPVMRMNSTAPTGQSMARKPSAYLLPPSSPTSGATIQNLGTSDQFQNVPQDPQHLIYMAMLVSGVGFLLPYSCLVIAADFFQLRYPHTTIVFDLSLVYITAAFASVCLCSLSVRWPSGGQRMRIGSLLSLTTMLFLSFLHIGSLPTGSKYTSDVELGYHLTLAGVGLLAFGCTLQQSSLYGAAAQLPSRYTHALMTGESAAGLIAAGGRLLSRFIITAPVANTLLFFGFCCTLLGVCAYVQAKLRSSDFYAINVRFCLANEGPSSLVNPAYDREPVPVSESTEFELPFGIDDEDTSRLARQRVTSQEVDRLNDTFDAFGTEENYEEDDEDEDELVFNVNNALYEQRRINNARGICRDTNRNTCQELGKESAIETNRRGAPTVVTIASGTGEASNSINSHISSVQPIARITQCVEHTTQKRLQLCSQIWPHMITIWLAYAVTLSLFPGIESEIVDCEWATWTPVILITLFNISDLIGKLLSAICLQVSSKNLLIASIIRCTLVPAMVACAGKSNIKSQSGWSRTIAPLLTVVLGISNGLLGSLPMILAPGNVHERHKELTGNLMTFCYLFGLTAGSAFAYLLRWGFVDPIQENIDTICFLNTSISS